MESLEAIAIHHLRLGYPRVINGSQETMVTSLNHCELRLDNDNSVNIVAPVIHKCGLKFQFLI